MAVIYVTCCWFVGICLATSADLSWQLWLGASAAAGAAAIGLRRQQGAALVALCCAALAAGGARETLARPALASASVAAYNGGPAVTLGGVVVTEPVLTDGALTVRLRAERIEVAENGQAVQGLVLVRLPRFARVGYGDRLQLAGQLAAPATDGRFDYRAYLARQGIYSEMAWPALEKVAAGPAPAFYRALFAFKARLQRVIDALFPGQEAALLSGILLGNDAGISPSLQEAFRRTGTSHIIAISGFNISLLAGMLLAVARPFSGARRAAWFPLAGVFLYTLLVGADAAVVRAAVMGSLYIGAGRLLGRPTFAPATLFSAGLLMTAINPLLLGDIGFQLTFAATLGLMVYVPPLRRRAQQWLEQAAILSRRGGQQLLNLLTEGVLVTVAAQVATLPLLLYHFGQLSLISLPANLLILPVQPAVMVAGGLATLVGSVGRAPALPLAWVAGLFLRYTIGVVQALANVPLAAVNVQMGLRGTVTCYLLLLAGSWFLLQQGERRLAWRRQVARQARAALPLLGATLFLLGWQWARTQPDGYLHVAFLDVGQGDATFIQTPSGRQLLIDGGHYPSRLDDRLATVVPFWDRHLDLMVATHADGDHVAGLPDLLRRYRVDLLLLGPGAVEVSEDSAYAALLANARRQQVPSRAVEAGERIVLEEGVYLECVHPDPGFGGDGNDNSLALRLVYGDFSLLLTGDAGEKGEAAMLGRGLPLQALVLKAGHHGARTSSSADFLAAVAPRIVIVSAGAENRFGHPHPEMLARATAAGATVLRTDQLGTIAVTSDGHRLWWEALAR